MTDPIITLTGIAKRYGGTAALSGVSLSVGHGEIIGLVGENGAGKSTLMKVLGGVIAPDAGEIRVNGTVVARMTVPAAHAAGIAFVHQELSNFENLPVAANILFGQEPLRGGILRLVDNAAALRRAGAILARLGSDIRPGAPLASLSLAQMQVVEIARALARNARLVIMDEPTSSLTATETDRLLDVVRGLRADGISVIFISHRLTEIERIADRAVVLRDGQLVAELPKASVRAAEMIRHMIGRDLKSVYAAPQSAPGAPVLQLRGLRTARFPHAPVDLDLLRGEILGLAGLIGAGRTELAETVFGLCPARGGAVHLDGAPVAIRSPAAAIAKGIYLIPEDRKRCGLVLDFPVAENISLASLRLLRRRGLVDRRAEMALAERQKVALDVRADNLRMPVGGLSGGNQQKVVLARWLALSPRVILFDEPTRGVDVGAKAEIYRLMRGLADRGVGVLMISSDMEEVIGVADRVVVMHEGRVAGTLGRAEVSEHAILSLAVSPDLHPLQEMHA